MRLSLFEMLQRMCNPDDPETWLILGMANESEILLTDYDGESPVTAPSLEEALKKKLDQRYES